MKILVVSEKPSITRAIAAAIANRHHGAAVAFIHAQRFGSARFSFPRGLKWSDYPSIAAPAYRQDAEHAWQGYIYNSGRLERQQDAPLDHWVQWADQIEFACDPSPAGVVNFLNSLAPACQAKGIDPTTCAAYVFDTLGEGAIEQAVSQAAWLRNSLGPQLAAGLAKRFFDFNWLVNAFAVLRPALKAAGVADSALPSKFGLQVLYLLREHGAMRVSRLLGVMGKWPGTGKHPHGQLGSAESRAQIIENLTDIGLLEGGDETPLVLTAKATDFLFRLHPDCRDLDLPQRLDRWMEQAQADPVAVQDAMAKYLRTFFGKQMRFKPSETETKVSLTPMAEALDLWQKIVGLNPNATSFYLGDYDLMDTFGKLQEAIDLDPSEITATLLLGYYLNRYLSMSEVTLKDLLTKEAPIRQRLDRCIKLQAIIERPEVIEARDRFIGNTRRALEQYGVATRDDINELLAKPDQVALLRRDALRSMEQLRVDQFLDGAPESPGAVPVYVKHVHQWWNVNSLLSSVTQMPSGVALNLIRHPDAYQCYFAFTIRNGGNLFVLSDTPDHPHPLRAYMSRRPEREMAKRAARNWFPYDLTNMAIDEESGALYFKESQHRGLVTYQPEAVPLKEISELGPEEIVWLSMMFDLIIERFWRKGWKAPALSYTGEMLKADAALIDAAKRNNLPVPAYAPVALAPLAIADVLTDAVSEDAVGPKAHMPNRWMEERYAERIPVEALNIVAPPETMLAIQNTDATGTLVPLDRKHVERLPWSRGEVEKTHTILNALNSTSFGTRDQLEKDRLFIARANLADNIQVLADREYGEREKEVLAWYKQKVTANIDKLLSWAMFDGVWVDDGQEDTFSHFGRHAGRCKIGTISNEGNEPRRRRCHSIIDRYDDEKVRDLWLHNNTTFGHWVRERGGYRTCHVNATRASYYVVYSPTNEHELALFAGCKVEELPDVIQHWSLYEPYTGNSILNRIDPMVWKLRNPWLKTDFRVSIPLSKRALAALEKTPGALPEVPNLIGLKEPVY